MGLIYYANIEDAHLSELLRYDSINTENQLMVLSNSICKDFPYTGRSIGSYIVFYQGLPIDHFTHVTGTVSQSSAESDYNAACISVMALENFRMLNNELLNKYTYVVPEQPPLIILDIESAIYIYKYGKENKHTRHIVRKMHLVRNGE